ncbi:MAG: hypothetical protein AAF656_02170 [Planctomycetota bacterium]
MSLSLHVSGDAAVSLRRLHIELQEAVYDVFEEFMADQTFLAPGSEHTSIATAMADGEFQAAVIELRVSATGDVVTVFHIEGPD